MLALIITILAILVLLLCSELWWRKKGTHGEFSRKFIHITVGSFAAFWPWFLSWDQILFLGAAFVVVVFISRYLDLFKVIHSVERPTWGEVCFAVSVGLLAIITHDRLIYMAALLTMSLADGLAAIIGVSYGRKNRYKVFGHTKSAIGTVTFFVIAFAILAGYRSVTQGAISVPSMVSLAIVAAALENIAVLGLDNLLVPLLLAVVLQRLG